MIANTNNGRQVTSTMTGDEIAMTINPEDFGKIIGIVTDLYSDRPMAVLREYSTNALDAHYMAGQKRPIEVTLPDRWSPFLKIKDYGVGLNHDEIRDVYAKYGKSMKSHSNDFNGMLGLGCKSGLTYADMFTVSSVKDGVRIQVSVSRSTGAPVMTVVDSAQTTDPNGVEVTIPASYFDRFESKARYLFGFWPEGSVLVNGKPPRRFVDEGHRKISDDLWIAGDNDFSTDIIVMGNVPYPAELDHSLPYGHKMVAFVPTGSVDFAPSREALMDTPVTKATLAKVLDDFKTKATTAAKTALANAATPQAAIREAKAWRQALGSDAIDFSQLSYRGHQFPGRITVPRDASGGPLGRFRIVNWRTSTYSSKQDTTYIEPEMLDGLVWVTNYDVETFSAPTKKKLLKWAEDKGLTAAEVSTFVLTNQPPPKFWVPQDRIVDYVEIKQVKLPLTQAQMNARSRGGTVSGRIPGSYDLIEFDGTRLVSHDGMPADDFGKRGLPIYWYRGSWSDGYEYGRALKRLHPKGFFLVILQRNRVEKFKRTFTKAENALEGVKKAYAAWETTVTKAQREALWVHDNLRLPHWLIRDPAGIKDPAVLKVCQMLNMDLTDLQAERTLFSRMRLSTVKLLDGVKGLSDPMTAYPLVRNTYGSPDPTHAKLYMNAVYEARKRGQL